MPFRIPTLPELAQRTANAFRANLKGSDARLWPNNVAVSAKVMAGAVWEAFAFLEYISRQSIKHLAEGPWLERHAYDYGLARLPATYAQGHVTISGDPNVAVPAGIVLQRADGVQYEVTTGGTVGVGGTVDLPVRCLTAGRIGNAVAGVVLTLTAPVDRLQTEHQVAASGIGTGADQESDESLRQRLLHRLRYPPHGGAAFDYVRWAREINGVTRVYVDPVTAENGRTTVGVWFLMDDLYPDGIPQVADVSAVRAYIETVRPAGALVEVAAPVPLPVDIAIEGLSPDTQAVRNAIVNELADLFRRNARVSTLTDPYTLYRSKIIEAISIAAGEDHHTLVAPAEDVSAGVGSIPVLGRVSFT